MAIRQIIFAVLTVVLSLWIYARRGPLKTFYFNDPRRFKEVRNDLYSFQHEHVSQVRNCEDIVLHEDETWAVLSCDPGRDSWNTVMGTFVDPSTTSTLSATLGSTTAETGLFIYDYSNSDRSTISKLNLMDCKLNSSEFHPLGIELSSQGFLYVINHGYSGPSLEVFRLFKGDLAATHIKTIRHPLLSTPNSIQILSESELLITNDHHYQVRHHPILARIETIAGIPQGTVIYLRFNERFEVLDASTLASMPFANGIARLNRTTFAVASSNTASIRFYELERSAVDSVHFRPTSSINLPFLPDNLSVDKQGVLLIAGHPHSPSLTKVAQNARFCSPEAQQQNVTLGEWCKRTLRPSYLSWVAEWTAQDGISTIYASQDDFGTSTTAVRDPDAGMGIVTGLYEQGLLRFNSRV